MTVCDDPPRPSEGSSIYQDMSGYMAARGDFLAEFSNYAENDVAELDFKSHDTDLDRSKFPLVFFFIVSSSISL